METSIWIVLSLMSSGQICAQNKDWSPQLGTASYPKLPELSPYAKKWDVYTLDHDHHLYLAEASGHVDHLTENKLWKQIPLGSLKNPKLTNSHDIFSEGEVFLEESTGKYFKSTCVPNSQVPSTGNGMVCLEELNIYADWMKLMRYMIEDTRLGDLAIPATHDTGTCGINEDSYLIDQNFLFRLGDIVVPEVLVNWSLTHDADILAQLESGFREFDLRVADCSSFNDTFRWWHGLSADEIEEGLQQIADFARDHPDEILMLDFQNFVRPFGTGTAPMLPGRKRDVNDLILSYLSDFMVPYVNISLNPTYNEVLATGRNVIAIMTDDDINAMSDLYWPSFLVVSQAGETNPEDLFRQRSGGLRGYLQNNPDQMTELSGAMTPNEVSIAAAMYRVYGDLPIIDEIYDRLIPGAHDLDADRMSFEGVYIDLLSAGRYGINTNGMSVRSEEYYSNGASIHYRGVNDMYGYWLARPGLYKANILYIDDAVLSSDIVATAIRANLKEIPREASITLQGSSRTGFYYWDNFTAHGGEEGLECETIQARFVIESTEYGLSEVANTGFEFIMQEGFYPPDSMIHLEVNSFGDDDVWNSLGSYHIQTLIEETRDMYIRGDNTGGGAGFAYLSEKYDLYAESCGSPPDPAGEDIIAFVQW